MRRLLALMAVVALVVAFALPMVGTAEAASHEGSKMNVCGAKAKDKKMMEKANPCAQNPCGQKAKGKEMMEKGEEMKAKGKEMMDKTKSK
jgi:hypothetical protein